MIDGVRSADSALKYGVPQGSVLGPILFTMYTQPLVSEIKRFGLNYHFYADDSQIYGSCSPENIKDLTKTLEMCVSSVKTWMNRNKLVLNGDKTEIVLTGSANAKAKVNQDCICLDNNTVTISKAAKNLGIVFDCDLSMSSAINQLTQKLYFEIHNISKIRHFLSNDIATLLVNTLVLSKLDYCNALFYGAKKELINKLQIAQNSAARLICKKK